MAGDKAFRALIVLVLVAVAVVAQEVQGPVHHVVGGNRRWDSDSDISSWLSGRVFRVGDKLWFTYSVPQESIVELQSLDEFQSCDLSNPIKMYTDGVDQIPLEGEGNRCFVIGNQENCNNGLKLHVDVKPSEPLPLPTFPPPSEPEPFTPSPPEPKPIFPPREPTFPPPSEPKPFTPPPPVPKPFTPPPPEPKPFFPPPPVPKPFTPPPPEPMPFFQPPPAPKPFSPPPPAPKPSPPPPPVPKPSSPPPPAPKPSPPPPKPSPPPPEPEPEPVPDTPPSGSTQLNGLPLGLFVGFVLCFFGQSMGL